MRRTLLIAALLAGCASTSASGPRAEVEDLVASRGGPDEVMPPTEQAESRREVSEKVEALLAQPLSEASAVRIAVLNNRQLRVTFEDLGVAQADLVQSGLLENPSISADLVNSTRGNGLGGGVSISQSVLSAFLIPARRRIAKADLERAVLQVSNATLGLVRDVRVAYAELRAATASAEQAKVMAQTSEVAADLARAQHAAGNIPDLDLELFLSELDRARLNLADHELEVERAREHVNGLLGLWGAQTDWTMAEAEPSGVPSLESLAGVESAGVEQRLDISAARANVESVRRALELRRRGVVPGIEVGAVARNEVGNDAGHEWVIGPEISIELPIFNPGHADFARLGAYLRAAEHELEQTAIMARAEIRTHRAELVTATRKLEYLRDTVLPRRDKLGRAALTRYNGMLLSAYELLELRAEQAEAYEAYVEAERDVAVATAELERAIGGPLPR